MSSLNPQKSTKYSNPDNAKSNSVITDTQIAANSVVSEPIPPFRISSIFLPSIRSIDAPSDQILA